MDPGPIIKQSLSEYDQYYEIMRPILVNTIHKIRRVTDNNGQVRQKIEFYSISGTREELIGSYDFEILSSYVPSKAMWIWSWHVAGTTQDNIRLAKKIMQYGINSNVDLIKLQLTCARIHINDPIQIEILLALSGQIIRNHFIIPSSIIGQNSSTGEHELSYDKRDSIITNYLIILADINQLLKKI